MEEEGWLNKIDRIASARYVSPEMTGYEDLDQYGAWSVFPEYGPCWVPAGLPVGWAPYRFGHWVWIAPWGWTWVDDMPWGFAPFHYGRWAYVRASWVWVPGPVVVRPVYAPALVAWVGGNGFSFSVVIGGGGIGWLPLGLREVFIPTYRVSEGYVTNINITNTVVNRTTIVNLYNNRNVANAAKRTSGHAIQTADLGKSASAKRSKPETIRVLTASAADALPSLWWMWGR